MAIQQSKKQSDLEKRLQLLRRQVYGKTPDRSDEIRKSENQKIDEPEGLTLRYTDTPIHRTSNAPISSDLTYLQHDLVRILIFASVAIGAQIVLFILSQKHILNIKFF